MIHFTCHDKVHSQAVAKFMFVLTSLCVCINLFESNFCEEKYDSNFIKKFFYQNDVYHENFPKEKEEIVSEMKWKVHEVVIK